MSVRDIYLLGVDTLSAKQEAKPENVADQVIRDVASFDAAAKQSRRLLKSEVPDAANDEQWTAFVFALKTAPQMDVSPSNCLGMFEMRVKRLLDFGLVKNVEYKRSPAGRMVWSGEFVPPLTDAAFRKSAALQYTVFSASMRDYAKKVDVDELPEGMTLSGALAILHRCGPNGLAMWENEASRFPDTIALYNRANGIF